MRNVIDTKVKTLKEIWKDDILLLSRAREHGIDFMYQGEQPNDRDAYEIMLKRSELLTTPKMPLKIDQTLIVPVVQRLTSDVETAWEAKFEIAPKVEVLGSIGYLARISQFEDESAAQFGQAPVKLESAPTMYFSPFHNTLLVPNTFIGRISKTTLTDMRGDRTSPFLDNWHCEEYTWDRNFFEEVLAQQIACALFRNLRKETGKNYVETINQVGQSAVSISAQNQALSLYTEERLANTQYPAWSFNAVTSKVTGVWGDRYKRARYLAIDALAGTKSLAQIAMPESTMGDDINQRVYVEFTPQHPNHKSKLERFVSQ
ncbi:MAG: hypothetical protein AABX11_05740 [Nanoarchaeota archaeon]